MSLLFNKLSRLVIAFLPGSKHLLISWLQSICSDFGAPQNKVCHCFHCFLIYLSWSNGIRCHDISFLNVEFYANFFHSPLSFSFSFFSLFPSFIFIERLFSSSSLSAIRVVLSPYLRLLIFLPAILISACASSSPAFLMMYFAYKLNKQRENIHPSHTPFLILNQSVVLHPVLTVVSWPAYRFFWTKVRWSGILIFFRILHSLLWSTQAKALA